MEPSPRRSKRRVLSRRSSHRIGFRFRIGAVRRSLLVIVGMAVLALTALGAAQARAGSPRGLTASASTSPAHPASVLLSLGVLGNSQRFQSLTGQRSTTGHLIVGWGQGAGFGSDFSSLFATMGQLPMLGINTGSAISPGEIGRGRGDDYLIALNRAIAAWAKPIYIRPLPEMNGHWNAYCAFNSNGSPRGADYSTANYRKAFARIYLIVHGGGAVNRRLRALGLPPVREPLAANALARVIWNPQGYGSPDVPGNSAAAYYPGDAYVDVVGDDLYDIRGKAEWAAAESLYNAHPGKPFAFPEWGLWGVDDPSFVDTMARFVSTHRRTQLVAYYSGQPGSVFDLASKPRSRSEYRRVIVALARQ